MTRQTRRSVLAALGVGLASAGCLSALDRVADGAGTAEPTSTTTTEESTAGEATTEQPPTEATTGDWIDRASNSPDPDHEITLRNDAAEPRRLRVAVVREATGETVFETTADVSPGGERVLYNLRDADPDGVETFRVCAELVGAAAATTGTGAAAETERTDSPRRDCATVDTNECYGSAHATLTEDGSVRIIYAIC